MYVYPQLGKDRISSSSAPLRPSHLAWLQPSHPASSVAKQYGVYHREAMAYAHLVVCQGNIPSGGFNIAMENHNV